MTSVERAKAFLSGTGKRLALTIVPLAVAVVSANAASFTPASSGNFNTGCSGGLGQPAILTTNTLQAASVGAGVTIFGNMTCSGIDNFGTATTVHDDAIGGSAAPIPVSYDFTVSSTAGPGSGFWVLDFQFFTSDPNTIQKTYTGNTTDPVSHITGLDTIDIGSATLTGYQVYLVAFWGPPAEFSQDLSVEIAAININADTAVPEPGVFLLTGSGLALLLAKYARKRA